MEEFDPKRDSFDSNIRHGPDENRVGEQFVNNHDYLVSVLQPLYRHEDGISGYLTNLIRLDTGEVERRAVSAERLDELIEGGKLESASAEIVR